MSEVIETSNDLLVSESSDPAFGKDLLTEVLRKGARDLLAQAIDLEVREWIEQRVAVVDEQGHRQVVRNGHLPERTIQSGIGPIEVRQPRVHDRRPKDEREIFSSKILPPYLRKTKALEELIPWLYLKGVSTGDFQEALQALVGPECPGLSANTVTRLKSVWQEQYEVWSKRSLAGKEYVYVWADGIYSNVRLADDKVCLLVLIGVTKEGQKELLAVWDGTRESELSWLEVLRDLKRRGLGIAPKLAIGDGGLGFWAALRKEWPNTREQRCWVHKTANVLNNLPKAMQPKAKGRLQDIWMAETRAAATKAFDAFLEDYSAKYPKATDCLKKDRDVLLTFYDFPAEHWRHIRTTNPIESTFATIRLRHRRTKGNGTRAATLTMLFKLAESAAKHWRILNAAKLLIEVAKDTKFQDGQILTQVAA
ncbi:MAG: IS256 family transposase [Planctomycetaceae bacterium]